MISWPSPARKATAFSDNTIFLAICCSSLSSTVAVDGNQPVTSPGQTACPGIPRLSATATVIRLRPGEPREGAESPDRLLAILHLVLRDLGGTSVTCPRKSCC